MGILIIVLLAFVIGSVIRTTETFYRNIREMEKQEGLGSQRCGVGLPPCHPFRERDRVRCINGWCRSDQIH
jgi:hypothetical protein